MEETAGMGRNDLIKEIKKLLKMATVNELDLVWRFLRGLVK